MTLTRFYKHNALILYEQTERNLGGRDIDKVVARRIAKDFEKTSGVDVTTDSKAMTTLEAAVNKSRSMLSVDDTTKINVDLLAAN